MSMASSLMSCVYLARPVTISRPSTRAVALPMSLNSGALGSAAGVGWAAAGLAASFFAGGFCAPACTAASPRAIDIYSLPLISGPLHFLGRGVDRLIDLGVIAAAAEVPGERQLDLVERRGRVLFEEGRGGHEEARRAEAALIAVLLDEGLLN